ncbi:23S rRNA (pseudouridine(1915)-N(3))-methyltransferase [Altererythrobacter insulae]|nr:23S rRNA (pseudouridine(1915)-N(3))-methyltransferase [Altererythrobacter insulae]
MNWSRQPERDCVTAGQAATRGRWRKPIGGRERKPMLLHVIARGKIARTPEAELVARYEKRLSWPVKLTELPESGGRIPEPQTPLKTVLLDERGKNLSSEELATVLGKWRDDGMREARFILGAADGHSAQDRSNADLLLAFGKATWPHLMARAMLMEQLYRVTTILAGHPYHRA